MVRHVVGLWESTLNTVPPITGALLSALLLVSIPYCPFHIGFELRVHKMYYSICEIRAHSGVTNALSEMRTHGFHPVYIHHWETNGALAQRFCCSSIAGGKARAASAASTELRSRSLEYQSVARLRVTIYCLVLAFTEIIIILDLKLFHFIHIFFEFISFYQLK